MRPTDDDERLGLLLKAIRRRERLRQHDVADLAGVSRRTEARIEQGQAGSLTLDTVRRIFAPLDARVRVTVWWHGAAADRLLDERHAALVEQAVGVLRWRVWITDVEVTFSEYGERGSIDILGWHPMTRSLLVVEVKSTLGSLEETNRMLDVKVRLAPRIARERFGRSAATVSRVLVLPDDPTVRRVIAAHRLTLATAYPARSREVRAWLRAPGATLRGIWFLSEGHHNATG